MMKHLLLAAIGLIGCAALAKAADLSDQAGKHHRDLGRAAQRMPPPARSRGN
jgi:hypothetical protein